MFNILSKNKLPKEEKQFNQQFSSGADDIILSKNLRKDFGNIIYAKRNRTYFYS